MSSNSSSSSSSRSDPDQNRWFYTEDLENLTHGDLPLASGDTEDPVVNHYRSLKIRRNLDWRNEKRQALPDGCKLQAAFAHTRGDEAPAPCLPCKDGKGPWNTCIAREHLGFAKWVPTDEACANCFFDERETECSHACAPGPARDSSTPSKRRTRSGANPERQPRPPRRTRKPQKTQTATGVDGDAENKGDGERHTPTAGTSRPTAIRDEEISDLESLLPASAYDDLPRLKRKRSDLMKMTFAVHGRITELEIERGKKVGRRNGEGPWKRWLE
ncbi:DUF3716 domain-containing protein [Aspergillus mulundensis]|uniref:Uncharacterized protein n=1 Tax=Aspergillus mulundensis TaxID=1810919 RepID=A0A3D8RZF4_9EURO|nr:hypothetical protein DSM5745_06076 [Aspergillus mulundensis]RDW79224.1 hypothetical protein DSM5745_06076 [Aspergillus mulundensis]